MSKPDTDPRPEPPPRPDNSECCGGGCIPCIFDFYEESMDMYRAELRAWEARQENSKPAGKKKARKPSGQRTPEPDR
jgi:hypothetical protein